MKLSPLTRHSLIKVSTDSSGLSQNPKKGGKGKGEIIFKIIIKFFVLNLYYIDYFLDILKILLDSSFIFLDILK